MPRLIAYRKNANSKETSLPLATLNAPNLLTLYPQQVRKVAFFDPSEERELRTNLEYMKDAGQIGYQIDHNDSDPDDIRINYGYELANGDSANSTSAYKNNVSSGEIRVGSDRYLYPGGVNLDPLALGIDTSGVSMAGRLLADGNAYKARWYAVRLHTVSSGVESVLAMPVFGAEDLTASVGAVTDTTKGFPSDAEVVAAFEALQETNKATFIYVDWVEFGRSLWSRSTTTITATYEDLKVRDLALPGLKKLDIIIDHVGLPGAGSHTVERRLPEGAIFVGACLRTTIPWAGLTTPTATFGVTGAADKFFDTLNLSTTVAKFEATVKATGGYDSGLVIVNGKALATLAASNDLDNATAGRSIWTVYYIALAEDAVESGITRQYDAEGEL